MKWKLPEPRTFNWKMKGMDSAVTEFNIDSDGVYHLHIKHDIIKGVTPEMIEWWFRNIGGTMEYDGKIYPRYLVWHPIDHIHWKLKKIGENGKVGVGSKFQIVEALNGNMDYLINTVDTVTKLDRSGIVLSLRILGIEVFKLVHNFIPHPMGTKYVSNMTVCSSHFLGRLLLNKIIRRYLFTKEMGHAWLKHNIEEVGNFEFFLPQLYLAENADSTSLRD
jgi:hypothetical protein